MNPCHSPKELRSVKYVCASSGSDFRNTATEEKLFIQEIVYAKHIHTAGVVIFNYNK